MTRVARVVVRVPAALRASAGGRSRLELDVTVGVAGEAPTVAAVFEALRQACPGVRHGALDERGAVRPHVNVFVNAEHIRHSGGLATPVCAGDEVWILPAVSGGGGA